MVTCHRRRDPPTSRSDSSSFFFISYHDFTPFRSAPSFRSLHYIQVETPPRFPLQSCPKKIPTRISTTIANAIAVMRDEITRCAFHHSSCFLSVAPLLHSLTTPGFRWGVGVNSQTLRNRRWVKSNTLNAPFSASEGDFSGLYTVTEEMQML